MKLSRQHKGMLLQENLWRPGLPPRNASRSWYVSIWRAGDWIIEASQAYLRIRPHFGDEPTSIPYLEPLSDTSVRMTDPSSDAQGASKIHYRASAIAPSSIYTFSHVFPPATVQEEFFSRTTLPLVRDLLDGQNGLLFAYGVTNSGKTYTIQGGNEPGTAGILPRSLDVLFNSIDDLHSNGRVSGQNAFRVCS